MKNTFVVVTFSTSDLGGIHILYIFSKAFESSVLTFNIAEVYHIIINLLLFMKILFMKLFMKMWYIYSVILHSSKE